MPQPDSPDISERYRGAKFCTLVTAAQHPFASDPRLARLKHWCREFHERGLAPPYDGGSYGNLSYRFNEFSPRFVITASNSGLADSCSDDRFVLVDSIDFEANTVQVTGTREPSSESLVHYGIYCRRPDVMAVLHGHCPLISRTADALGIPVTHARQPYGTTALLNSVLDVLAGAWFVEMRGHGFLSLGTSIDDAGERAAALLLQAGECTAPSPG